MKIITDEAIKGLAAQDPFPWFNSMEWLSLIGLVILTMLGQIAMWLYSSAGVEVKASLVRLLGSEMAANVSVYMVFYNIFPALLITGLVFLWVALVFRFFASFLILFAQNEVKRRNITMDK